MPNKLSGQGQTLFIILPTTYLDAYLDKSPKEQTN